MMLVCSRNRLPATPTQNQEEYSGTERIYETRSAARVKRGSEGIHSSFPRGGSFKHNKGRVVSKIEKTDLLEGQEHSVFPAFWLPFQSNTEQENQLKKKTRCT